MSKKSYSALAAGPIEDTIMNKYKRTAVKQDLYDFHRRPDNLLRMSEVLLYLYKPYMWKRLYGEKRARDNEGHIIPSKKDRCQNIESKELNIATSLVSLSPDKDEIAMFLSKSVEYQILRPNCQYNCLDRIYVYCRKDSCFFAPKDAVNLLDFVQDWLWKCHPADGQILKEKLTTLMYHIRVGKLILPDNTKWEEEVSTMFICAVMDFLTRCQEWSCRNKNKEDDECPL